jgi:hypothetical protein
MPLVKVGMLDGLDGSEALKLVRMDDGEMESSKNCESLPMVDSADAN